MPITKDDIKQMKKKRKVKIGDMLALTAGYDPFYVGGDIDKRDAQWAKDLLDDVMSRWEERKRELRRIGYNVGNNPHLRAIHYVLVNMETPVRWDGERYKGSLGEWHKLGDCFRKARLMKLIPFGMIEDHKHPDVVTNVSRYDDDEIDYPDDNETVEIDNSDITIELDDDIWDQIRVREWVSMSVGKRVPVHLEIWTEKERELVDAVAKRYYCNVQHATGQQSYENIYSVLKRAIKNSKGRPIRILYLSDYDPRGEMTMPVGVSRLIEWMVDNLDEFKDLNVKLKKVLLTQEQIEEYNLPPAPVKEKEAMKERWANARGGNMSVVEIDAIEVNFAVEMVRILEDELKKYISDDARDYIKQFNTDLETALEEFNAKVQNDIEAKSSEVEDTLQELKDQLSVNESLDFNLSEYKEELKEFVDSWEEPEWDIDDGEDEDWLFDSQREYMDQMGYYKRMRGEE